MPREVTDAVLADIDTLAFDFVDKLVERVASEPIRFFDEDRLHEDLYCDLCVEVRQLVERLLSEETADAA